ncbi:hypothetical protein WDU94_013872, partial [Cyamophila willieti]
SHTGNNTKENLLQISSWNIRTLLDSAKPTSLTIPRRTAVVARELKRYDIDIAALQETHLKESGQVEEKHAGYTYFWSGCSEDQPNYYGVALCVKSHLIKKGIVSEPNCYSDRIMSISIREQNSDIELINCYAPTMNNDINVIETFYEDLKKVIEDIPKKKDIIIAGDFNARVGQHHNVWKGILGPHGTGVMNANGLRLLQMCAEQDLRISNTFFQQKDMYKTTWQHPRSKQWHTIDYIISRRTNKSRVLRCRAMRGAQCDTDHQLLRAVIKARVKPLFHKKKNTHLAYNLDKLTDNSTRHNFEEMIRNNANIENNSHSTSVEDTWTTIKSAYQNSASRVLGKKETTTTDWFDECDVRIEEELAKKKETHQRYLLAPTERNKKAYQEARSKCQREVRRMKDEWWNKRMTVLQDFMNKGDMYNLYKGISAMVGPIKKPLNIIEDELGAPIKIKEKRLERWRKHFEGVYNQETNVNLENIVVEPMTSNIPDDGPPSEIEIDKAIGQLKNKKSPGIDGITAELIKGARNTSIGLLHELFKRIWEEKCVPADWRDATVVPIFKKGNKAKCDNYRGISLLSIPGKILSRVLYNRLNPFLEQYLEETQSGFRPSRSTVDMIFSSRQIIEKTLEQNTQMGVAFVDISKAFDSVNREALFTIMAQLNCPPTVLAILKSLHDQTQASIRLEGDLTAPFQVKSGVRQGCVLAPLLFIVYMQTIMNKTKHINRTGIEIQFRSDSDMFSKRSLLSKTKTRLALITDLLYADDCALVAKTAGELQILLDAFVTAAEELGLKANVKKTEVMYVNMPPPASPITIGNEPLTVVENFKYLGSRIAKTNDITIEVKGRISAASASFGKLYTRVWKQHNLSL